MPIQISKVSATLATIGILFFVLSKSTPASAVTCATLNYNGLIQLGTGSLGTLVNQTATAAFNFCDDATNAADPIATDTHWFLSGLGYSVEIGSDVWTGTNFSIRQQEISATSHRLEFNTSPDSAGLFGSPASDLTGPFDLTEILVAFDGSGLFPALAILPFDDTAWSIDSSRLIAFSSLDFILGDGGSLTLSPFTLPDPGPVDPPQQVPAPPALALFLTGLIGLAFTRRRRSI